MGGWRSTLVAVAVVAWLSVPVAMVAALAITVELPTLLASVPSGLSDLHHGLLVWWPLAVAAALGITLNQAIRRFGATLLTKDNFAVSRQFAVTGFVACIVMPPLLLMRPLAFVLGLAVLVGVSGFSVRRYQTSMERPAGPVWRVGWAMTWRLMAMALPIYLAMFGVIAMLSALVIAPGLGLVSALQEDPARAETLRWIGPALPAAIRVYTYALVGLTLAVSAGWMFAGLSYLPGHVARRADAQGAFD